MAGISKTRIDYGDKGPVKQSVDLRSGDSPQDSSVPTPTRAQRPIGSTENDNLSSESAATKAARPTTGKS